MLNFLRGFMSSDLSIDLGTANTLIYKRGEGIVLNEPSVVAIAEVQGQKVVVSVGSEAKKMLGKTPRGLEAIRPLKDGVIAEIGVTEQLLKALLGRVNKRSMLFPRPGPRVLVCVPCKATEVERRAIRESVYTTGAREVILIEEPIAAALGAGLPLNEAHGKVVVDIGGGTTEIAVISLDGIVYSETLRVGGDHFDRAIVSFLREKYQVQIGETSAEEIKIELGTAVEPQSKEEVRRMDVRGLNLSKGLPERIMITSTDVWSALRSELAQIVRGVKLALENSPPELVADIVDSGIVLTGGGALLSNIDQLISNQTSVPTVLADDALTCVARGGGVALELMDQASRWRVLTTQ